MNNYPMRHRISIKRKQFEKTGLWRGSAPAQEDVGSVSEKEPAADHSLLRVSDSVPMVFILNHEFCLVCDS